MDALLRKTENIAKQQQQQREREVDKYERKKKNRQTSKRAKSGRRSGVSGGERAALRETHVSASRCVHRLGDGAADTMPAAEAVAGVLATNAYDPADPLCEEADDIHG